MDFNSKPIENTYSPKPPDIRYYNNATAETCGKIENTNTLSSNLYTNLQNSCSNITESIYSNKLRPLGLCHNSILFHSLIF